MIRIVLSLIVLATLLYVGSHYADELHRLGDVSLWAALGIIALYLPARWLSAEVMRASLVSLGNTVGAVEIVLLTFANSYMNLVIPRAGLGMPAMYLKVRRGVPIADVSAVQIVSMTMLQTTCIGVIGLISLLLVHQAYGRSVPVALYGVFAAVAIGTSALLMFPIRIGPHWPGKIANFAHKVTENWHRLSRDRTAVVRILLIQSIVLLLRAARLQLCFHAIGQPVGYLPALAASLLADVGSLISVTPGALGFRETAIVLTSSLLGATRDVGLAAALLDRVVTTGVIILIGQVAMWQLIRPARAVSRAPAPAE